MADLCLCAAAGRGAAVREGASMRFHRTPVITCRRRPACERPGQVRAMPSTTTATRAPSETQPRPGPGNGDQRYPYIDQSYPGLQVLNEEPPVYLIRNFLSEAHCDALRAAAVEGVLPEIQYDNSVHLDAAKLRLLAPIAVLGAVPPALHAAEAGASTAQILAAGGQALGIAAAGMFVLTRVVVLAVQASIGGKIFSGSKWTTRELRAATPEAGSDEAGVQRNALRANAIAARAAFVDAYTRLIDTPESHLEEPMVTRYQEGDYQLTHIDARTAGDMGEDMEAFMARGGQRLVQCVCYLSGDDEGTGGATSFDHPCMEGLKVAPTRGSALVFFPAFRDGRSDDRMTHSGQRVDSGEKWIVNSWACEKAVEVLPQHAPRSA
ncbi:unnamed protein product [Pedinophyceae sp. YPF-701]|nr:unnamed protein product [Pedinophyceae sp. YPF-701]